jgi:signal transduction histidine kinase/DNA-binding response OmpR family regulator/CHASE3 domain sensor protein
VADRFERQIAFRLGLAAAALVVLGIAGYATILGALVRARRVEHGHEVLRGLENVVSALKDAETGQRGYLLTGHDRYLEPYNAGIGALGQQIESLERLIDDEVKPRTHLDELRVLIRRKLAELRETVDLRREQGSAAALAVVLTDRGRVLMDEIRAGVRQMQDEEKARLARLGASADVAAVAATVASIAVGAVAVAVLALAYRMIVRELAARRRAEELLRAQASTLEAAQARLTASSQFVAALNQPGMMDTYRAALGCLARIAGAPLAILYDALEGAAPMARIAIGPDLGPLEAAELQGHGLPASVAWSGTEQELVGPFSDETLRVRYGLGAAPLRSVVGWPVTFRGRTLGVLVTAHLTPLDDLRRNAIRAAIEQFAVRIEGYQIEAQRLRLLADLQAQSRALDAARQEAERANRAKSEFLAAMSHELRTPMNSIMGFTARLIRKLGDTLPEREVDALRTVDRNAKHLLGLINDILDLSKIEAGKMECRPERFNLADVVRDVVGQAAPLLDGKPVALELDLPVAPVEIEADLRMLRQVTLNLVSNAIKFTDRGRVRVALADTEDGVIGSAVRLSVRDTGIGIRPDDRARLFRRFSQLDGGPNRRAGGTGLGLVLSDQMVRLHGGRIDVESEPGAGSEFFVLLPRRSAACRTGAVPAPEAALSRTPETPDRAGDEAGRGVTILCVDDEPDTLKFFKLTFEDAGYHVLTAHGGKEALEEARDRCPDLVCLDLSMPGTDGFEVLLRMREDPGLSRIPVVVVSATSEEARALSAGARRYLAKPAEAEDLVDAVRDVLGVTAGEVLIIEDDPDVRDLLGSALREHGLHVRTAANGREGLDRLSEGTPAAIVLDLLMPVMDGFTFLEYLTRDPVWHCIPVVILSGRALEAQEIAHLRRFCSCVLTKGREEAERLTDALLQAIIPRRRVEELGRV